MKSGSRDPAEGAVKKAKARVKKKSAKAAGAPDMRSEGTVERSVSEWQKKTGQIELDRLRE